MGKLANPRPRRPALAVAAVATLAGLLLASNAQLARNTLFGRGTAEVRQQPNLAQLVAQETARVDTLTEQVARVNLDIEEMMAALAPATALVPDDGALAALEAASIGLTAVAGPGVTVALNDAPASAALLDGVAPDDLVIHQQDLQAVIMALWAGGAEAMTLMGERVTMTSSFRCVGNVLLLHGRVFSPPFVVAAIGDPDALERSVLRSPGVQTFLGYVEWLGLGFSLSRSDLLELPAQAGTPSLRFAGLAADESPWR